MSTYYYKDAEIKKAWLAASPKDKAGIKAFMDTPHVRVHGGGRVDTYFLCKIKLLMPPYRSFVACGMGSGHGISRGAMRKIVGLPALPLLQEPKVARSNPRGLPSRSATKQKGVANGRKSSR